MSKAKSSSKTRSSKSKAAKADGEVSSPKAEPVPAEVAHEEAHPKRSSSRAKELEPFDGDAFNGPGVRCKRTGVVIPDGPEFEQRKADHLASLDS